MCDLRYRWYTVLFKYPTLKITLKGYTLKVKPGPIFFLQILYVIRHIFIPNEQKYVPQFHNTYDIFTPLSSH